MWKFDLKFYFVVFGRQHNEDNDDNTHVNEHPQHKLYIHSHR